MQVDRLAFSKGSRRDLGLARRQRDQLLPLHAPWNRSDGQHNAVATGGASCLKRRMTFTISDRTKCRGPVAGNRCAAHDAPVYNSECARGIQVDQQALSLLEQLIRREGQAASQHADSVRDVRPGGHDTVKHAAHNTPEAGLSVEVHHVVNYGDTAISYGAVSSGRQGYPI
eukprot:6191585-Pleurochrysis_carterae.AAC.5